MTATYKVTGVKVRFAPGYVLRLSKKQAAIRAPFLEKAKGKDCYTVLKTVEFKQGETLGVAEGDIPKSWWDTLEQTNTKARPDAADFEAVHKGFGKWDVINADGEPINTEPLTKAEAQALLDAQDGEEEETGTDNPDETQGDENPDGDSDGEGTTEPNGGDA
jgi:hypothetical protein